jgi:hypothetical protein
MTLTASTGAAAWFAAVPIDTSSTLFFIGADVAPLNRALAERGWRGHVVHLAPPTFAGLDDLMHSLEPDAEHPVVVLQPGVMGAHREAVKEAARRIGRTWFGARANQEARRENAGRYLLNTLRNFGSIAAEGDATALTGAFTGVPAIVVAAGPSLDRNLAGIVEQRDRALIIAVDTALRPLLAAGVAPDFVVAVDPSEANANHLVDLPPCPATHLVAEGSIDPEALPQFRGRTFFFRVANHHPWAWFREQGLDRARLRAWGSVLTTAFDLTLEMGCSPIVFAGADLAFTDCRPYARGTFNEESWRREHAWGSTLDEVWARRLADWPETMEAGVNGVPVRTAPHLRSFRDWIVTQAGQLTDRTLINATGEGILVGRDIVQASLRDALGGRPALATAVRDSISSRRQRPSSGTQRPIGVPAATRDAWIAFASVSSAAIDQALLPRAEAAPASVIAVPDQPKPDSDAAFLAELARTFEIETVTLGHPDQDLLADVRRATHRLPESRAVVIVDQIGHSVGSQVRRVTNRLLCERADLWIEDRRFADRRSRLMVIRSGADRRPVDPAKTDAVKWESGHQAVANSLAPLIARAFTPGSVIDIGCGAGYWLQAFAAQGVTDLAGITPNLEGAAVVTSVARGSLNNVDLGRRFDLALCLEVAQRLSRDDQHALIESCVRASDVVVFSSAPPGASWGSPHDRPLEHWAERFWRHGYVIDDRLRPLLEQRANHPATIYDCLVVFRKQFSPGDVANQRLENWVLEQAARIHDLFMQRIWWATEAAAYTAPGTEPPRSRCEPWVMPPSRMAMADGSARIFRFRTDAARWYVTHRGFALCVREDGRPLDHASAWRDEVMFRSSDGSDPRVNGRCYTIDLPSHVAWAESQPLADILRIEL